MTLYADILFFVNFIMNGFVLWVLSKVMRERRKARRFFLGAGVMALLYTLLIIAPPLRFINVVIASVVILAAGVFVTFHPKKIKPFVKLMTVAYIISFTVGGLGMALFFLTDLPYAIYFLAGFDSFSVSWKIVLAGTLLSYITIKISMKMAERITLKRQMLCNVCITIGENICNFNALVDTGHNLKEPLSQIPVIIAEFEQIKPLLPECLIIVFSEKSENDPSFLLSVREESFFNRIRVIPFTSLGRNNGMLIGFKPDNVKLEGIEKTPDVIIGIYNDTLSRSGKYQGLLSPEIVA